MLIQWQSGEAASLHILVIHAMTILLTYGPPESSESDELNRQGSIYFGQLLDVWFPAGGIHPPPQAYLVETTEEALLYPDWLKLRMIRSPVDALVDTALKDLEPAQLILFIQSFGIPVPSMTKLLTALDRMVQANAFAFVEVDMDKTYIQQLLHIQWARGARGGLHFADIMQLTNPEASRPPADNKNLIRMGRPYLDIPATSTTLPASGVTADGALSVLRQLFDIKTVIRLSQPEKIKAFRMLGNALALETRSPVHPSAEACALALDSLLVSAAGSRHETESLLAAMDRQPAFSCGLLRLLTSAASCPSAVSRLLPIVRSICQKIAIGASASASAFRTTAVQFVKSHGVGIRPPESADLSNSGGGGLDVSSKRLERHLQRMASGALETNDTRSLVESIVANLNRSGSVGNGFAGLLIDWMELLDPEMIAAQPDAEVLFCFLRIFLPVC